MRLLCRKYHFLENSKNRIPVKKFFLAKQKNMCRFIVDKEPKKMISFKSATSTVNLIWNDPYIKIYKKRRTHAQRTDSLDFSDHSDLSIFHTKKFKSIFQLKDMFSLSIY